MNLYEIFEFLISGIFVASILLLAFIDARTLTIPPAFHLLFLSLAVIRLCFLDLALGQSLLGSVIVSLPMALANLGGQRIGGGDVKLAASCGLFLGSQAVLLGAVLGFLLAGLFAMMAGFLAVVRREKVERIALGPFLGGGFIYAYLLDLDLLDQRLDYLNFVTWLDCLL